MTYRFIQLAYLDTISGDDRELRQTLLEMVQHEIQTAIPAMKQAFQLKNWEELQEVSHKLKSTLAFVGNTDLTAANQAILTHLEEERFSFDYETQLAVLLQLLGPVLTELRQEL